MNDSSYEKILQKLYRNIEQFTPVAELLKCAGSRRDRFDRAMLQLADQGQALTTSPAGVRLAVPIMLAAELIEPELGTLRLGHNVICFRQIGSTNDVAFDAARQKDSNGLVVLAESQQAGRGRLGRKWISRAGENILMSVLLKAGANNPSYDALTIAAGLAVADAVSDVLGLHANLKWPNDLLIDGAKIAGVLVESRGSASRRDIVVGIGVNANSHPPAGELEKPATDLASITGHYVDRIALIRRIVQSLDRRLADIREGRTDGIVADWRGRCCMINQRLTVASGGKQFTGRMLDVSPLEGLIIVDDSGVHHCLRAETSTIVV